MSSAVDDRLGALLGTNFKDQSAARIVRSTSTMFARDDVSVRDLFWIYEYLLDQRDSEDTRKRIATQLNGKYGKSETREKTLDVVRLMSEGNPAYRKKNEGEMLIPHLCRPLQETVVSQQVYSQERMRNAGDAMLDTDDIKRHINLAIEQRLGGKPKNRN